MDMKIIGVDAPPYPQLRNFIEIYLKPLEDINCICSGKGIYIIDVDKVECLRNARINVPEAEDAINIIKKRNILFKALRAPVTGPFTLASRVYISSEISKGLSSTCLSRKELVTGVFTDFVMNIVSYLINLGYNVVFMDEPVFNYIIGSKKILFNYREDEIIDVLDKVTSARSSIEFGIHVCGKLNQRIIEILLELPKVKYISIELHDSPLNLELLSKELFEKYDKILSPGIVSSQRTVVESVDEAFSVLKLAYERVSGRIDLVSGDCGFGGLKGALGDREKEYHVALSKLKTVVGAVQILRTSLAT